ncbi:ubiquilin [Nematocida homosporus]|uniref:ubiquilin n=1 Tax=Nematocida homosporus TaxID=1912981 RepID=UPI00221F272B|nr:ubiquilin [Nematocida homosporus]KAI5187480.1 ubiquilin [Nematocida homosporus]
MHRLTINYMQESFEIQVAEKETIDELKKKIAEKTQVLPERQRLTHKGSILHEGHKTMQDIGVDSTSVIYVSKVEDSHGPKEIKGQVHPQQPVHPGMAMMKDPGMKKIFSNPEVVKGIIDMFPEMKKDNPELRKLMESSQMLEEMAKLAEDPDYMNTQMKNIDIAMAKLETIPGGFNMLRGMLKTQKDPSAGLAEGLDMTSFKEGSAVVPEIGKPAPNPWGSYNFNPILEYRRQVEYMKECGFTDVGSNIQLLIKHQGNVDEAISEILSASMHSPTTDTESRI